MIMAFCSYDVTSLRVQGVSANMFTAGPAGNQSVLLCVAGALLQFNKLVSASAFASGHQSAGY